MKKSELKKIIKEELKNVLKESFYRLPGHVIGNEFYSVVNQLKSIYDGQKNGNDFNPKDLANIISTLQAIKKEAKQFNSEDEVPISYKYGNKK